MPIRDRPLPPLPSLRPSSLTIALRSHRILTHLLDFLSFPDLLALLHTSSLHRRLFDHPHLRDAVLARYVSGYSSALRWRDLNRYQDVPLSLSDLDIFLISQNLPLHQYPKHALTLLTAPSTDLFLSYKLSSLALAHSRFVLLLQALVHSTASDPPPEPPQFALRSSQTSLRELTFPAPLSSLPPSPCISFLSTPGPTHSRSRSTPASIRTAAKAPPSSFSSLPARASAFPHSSAPTLVKRSSIFGPPRTLPPPPTEPRTLRFYPGAGGWRRRSVLHRPSTAPGFLSSEFAHDDDDGYLPRPHRRFATSPTTTPSSSNSGSSASMVSPLSSDTSAPPSPPVPASLRYTTPAPAPASPHSPQHHTSRTRAPVLRVFAPSSAPWLGPSATAAANQLARAGLWPLLSVGDLVCNLGWVPVSSPTPSFDDLEFGVLPTSPSSNESTQWLLFTGTHLTPFSPPSPPPLSRPWALPSPFYFAHITPTDGDQHFVWRGMPPLTTPTDADGSPRLVRLVTRIRSPHSPGGWAAVRRWVWVARVLVGLGNDDTGDDDGVGGGWRGEWTVEGPGTREGRAAVARCLCEGGGAMPDAHEREWELVRERCARGRLWFRLVRTLDADGGARAFDPYADC